MARKKKLADRLRDARDLIAKPNAWVKGIFHDQRYKVGHYPELVDAYCALGALEMKGANTVVGRRLINRAILIVDPTFAPPKYMSPNPAGYITGFNDRRQTRKKDVIAVFNKAIELAEAPLAPKEAARG